MKVIDGEALAQDFKNDRTNLFLDGLKGTPRERSISISNVIERIEDAPVLSGEEILSEVFKIDKLTFSIDDAKKLEQYRKICGDIVVHSEDTVSFINDPKTEYLDKSVAKVFQNMAYRRGVRDLQEKLIGVVEECWNQTHTPMTRLEIFRIVNDTANEVVRNHNKEIDENGSI